MAGRLVVGGRKPVRYAVHGAVLVTLLCGAAAVTGSSTKVTVTVDGRARTVTTSASDVRGVLARAGIHVGAHDTLVPTASTAVHDGSQIVVTHARPLTLVIDGTSRTIWVTQPTIGDAVSALGLRLDGAYLSASRSGRIPLRGATVVVQLPHTIQLVADGHRRADVTTAVTVADALAEAGVALGPLDKVSVPTSTPPTDGLTVKITRIRQKVARVITTLPAPTTRVADDSLYRGQQEVRRKGHPGRYIRWFRMSYADGHLASKTVVRTHRDAPVPTVVAYGTKARPVPVVHRSVPKRSYPASSSGLDWAAVAQCESGGDPSLVDPPYYGLYQFTIGTWESVGGHGLPSDASASEQTYRAQLLYDRAGASPWPVCGKYL